MNTGCDVLSSILMRKMLWTILWGNVSLWLLNIQIYSDCEYEIRSCVVNGSIFFGISWSEQAPTIQSHKFPILLHPSCFWYCWFSHTITYHLANIALCSEVRSAPSLLIFRKSLKTYSSEGHRGLVRTWGGSLSNWISCVCLFFFFFK